MRLPPSLNLGLQKLPVRLAPLPAGAEVSITGDVLPSLQRFLTMEVSESVHSDGISQRRGGTL